MIHIPIRIPMCFVTSVHYVPWEGSMLPGNHPPIVWEFDPCWLFSFFDVRSECEFQLPFPELDIHNLCWSQLTQVQWSLCVQLSGICIEYCWSVYVCIITYGSKMRSSQASAECICLGLIKSTTLLSKKHVCMNDIRNNRVGRNNGIWVSWEELYFTHFNAVHT